MDNRVMSDSYCEALAYMIITNAQALEEEQGRGFYFAFPAKYKQQIRRGGTEASCRGD
ncbi:MAG: hypothetical protein HQK96_15260 [Nitrospirae bacterium]|nr:hypothetical protein [Nitrospirota bacterium]